MKPEEIEVGRKYKNKDYDDIGAVWIGAGKRKPFTEGPRIEFTEKYLVLIESEKGVIGCIFKTPEDDYGSTQEDWDMFYKV